MKASLTFLLLIFATFEAKYAPFEDFHEKIHVQILDFTYVGDGPQYCYEEFLRIDITVTGVDVQKQGINFYDFKDVCCQDHKPEHRPIDQIVCLMPEVQYGKVVDWTKGFTLTPPNFILSNEAQCEAFKDFDPRNPTHWSLLKSKSGFPSTYIED